MKLPPVKLQKETEQIRVSVAENIILREMALFYHRLTPIALDPVLLYGNCIGSPRMASVNDFRFFDIMYLNIGSVALYH